MFDMILEQVFLEVQSHTIPPDEVLLFLFFFSTENNSNNPNKI